MNCHNSRTIRSFDLKFGPHVQCWTGSQQVYNLGCILRELGENIKNNLKQVKITCKIKTFSKTLDSQETYKDCQSRLEINTSKRERAFS